MENEGADLGGGVRVLNHEQLALDEVLDLRRKLLSPEPLAVGEVAQ